MAHPNKACFFLIQFLIQVVVQIYHDTTKQSLWWLDELARNISRDNKTIIARYDTKRRRAAHVHPAAILVDQLVDPQLLHVRPDRLNHLADRTERRNREVGR